MRSPCNHGSIHPGVGRQTSIRVKLLLTQRSAIEFARGAWIGVRGPWCGKSPAATLTIEQAPRERAIIYLWRGCCVLGADTARTCAS
jgi:hypothetical protein